MTSSGAIPGGLQRLLRLAAADAGFRRALIEQRGDAAAAAGVELTSSERAILAAISGDQLAEMAAKLPQESVSRRAVSTHRVAASAALVLGGAGLAEGAAGCAPSTPQPDRPQHNIMNVCGGTAPDIPGLGEKAVKHFSTGLQELLSHDQASDWTAAHCEQVAGEFLASEAIQDRGSGSGGFAEASYNAAIVFRRCGEHERARERFAEIVRRHPEFHRARVHLALYDLQAAGDEGIDRAIREMRRAIRDAEFKNEEALVQLAMLQLRRRSTGPDEGAFGNSPDDLTRAKLNFQRALAINDAFMPAFNGLAVYYLEMARGFAARPGMRIAVQQGTTQADTAQLELAALVCSQAIAREPGYAPIHNTSGLISVELGDLSAAAASFATARKLDKRFFQAQMNYAAVNLRFRGFTEAEAAYREALAQQPKHYDVHLGLALAIRGQIDPGNQAVRLPEALELLRAAQAIDGNRPEAYFNEAILVQEYEARTGSAAALTRAQKLFRTFLKKAASKPEHQQAERRATERLADIDTILTFRKQSSP